MSGSLSDSSPSPLVPPQVVTVRTGARLHFGPLSFHPEHGRHFGGIGMMVNAPQLEVRAKHGTSPQTGPLADLVATISQPGQIPDDAPPRPPVNVEVVQPLPRHAGLGSGTQQALAVAEAVFALHYSPFSLPETLSNPQTLAALTRRGRRSGIGIAGYADGGFLVDAGHRERGTTSQIAAREDFPASWRVILIQPHHETGRCGDAEETSLADLQPMPTGDSEKLCRLVLTEILPALRNRDFPTFSEAISEYGQRVGAFFAPVQGGAYSSPVIRELSKLRKSPRRSEFLQSSWGPTAAVITDSDDAAAVFLQNLQRSPLWEQVTVTVTNGRNVGREVTFAPASPLPE